MDVFHSQQTGEKGAIQPLERAQELTLHPEWSLSLHLAGMFQKFHVGVQRLAQARPWRVPEPRLNSPWSSTSSSSASPATMEVARNLVLLLAWSGSHYAYMAGLLNNAYCLWRFVFLAQARFRSTEILCLIARNLGRCSKSRTGSCNRALMYRLKFPAVRCLC